MKKRTDYVLGYGIHINVLPEITVEKLAELIHSAPKFERRLYFEMLEESMNEYIRRTDKLDVASVLLEVIKECEGLDLIIAATDEGDGDEIFLLYPPTYPWEITDNNKIGLAEISAVFKKYTLILTGQEIEPQYFDWGRTS